MLGEHLRRGDGEDEKDHGRRGRHAHLAARCFILKAGNPMSSFLRQSRILRYRPIPSIVRTSGRRKSVGCFLRCAAELYRCNSVFVARRYGDISRLIKIDATLTKAYDDVGLIVLPFFEMANTVVPPSGAPRRRRLRQVGG